MKSLKQYINEVSSDLLKRAHNEQVRRNNGVESNRSRKFAKGAHAALDREMSLDDSISGKEKQYDYVDLGLPSGTMWATCNVGATKPEDEGLLFQFGRVDGYRYEDKNDQFRTNDQNKQDTGNKFIPLTASGKAYKTNEILDLSDDAAHVNMGGKWKMPTKYQLEELIDNTTREVETINGVKGIMFTSNINGNQLFIPFIQGCWYDGNWETWEVYATIWSSQVHTSYDDYAYRLNLDSESGDAGAYVEGAYTRNYAFTVRGVFKK